VTLARITIALLAFVVSLSIACGGDDNGTPSPTASPTPTATPAATNGGIVPPSNSPQPTNTFIYSTASTTNERVVALLDSGFTADGGEISGAVLLHNRNKTEATVAQVRVTPVFDGTDGDPKTYNVVLLPDQIMGAAFDVTYPASAQTASAKIAVLPPTQWVAFTPPERLVATLNSSSKANGTITNPYDHDTGPLTLTIIARNEGGQVIDAASVAIDSIAPNGSATFSVPVPNTINGFSAFVTFADALPDWIPSG
jgi:hypothetical protein